MEKLRSHNCRPSKIDRYLTRKIFKLERYLTREVPRVKRSSELHIYLTLIEKNTVFNKLCVQLSPFS